MKVLNGLDLSNQKIIALADPSVGTDAANKQYVDNVARGLAWKEPVRAASTGNINTASPGATIDGVTLTNGDRVLLKDQTTSAEKGIWVWNGASSAMTRAADMAAASTLKPGTAVSVTEGSTNGDKAFLVVSDTNITVGTDAQTWGQLGGGGGVTYTAGNGINITGDVISADAGNGIVVDGDGIRLDTSVAARKYSVNVGNGSLTSIVLTHNLGTKDVVVSVRDNSTDDGVIVDWEATDTNTVTLTFAVAPSSNAYRATVIG